MMNGDALDAAQITAISKLPSRQVLYGQLVGMIASPLTGLARSLNGLVGGLAIALGGVLEKKESGEIPSGAAPAASAAPAAEEAAAPAEEEAAAEAPAAEAETTTENTEEPAEGPDQTEETQEG
jgi:large subunit ribosomal protein L10